MKRIRILLCCLFGIIACGFAQKKVVFALQWLPQSQFAGYYAAVQNGYYKELGIDVVFDYPLISEKAGNVLDKKSSQVVAMTLMHAIISCAEGHEVVNILQPSQNCSLVVVSHAENPLKGAKDFQGIRIGYFNAGFNEVAQVYEALEGISWKPYYFEYNFNLFLENLVDATLAMEYNELQQMIYSGVEITEDNVFRFSENGYNIPGDGIYVTRENYDKNPQLYQKIAEASRKGWQWVSEHRDEAIDIIMNEIHFQGRFTNRIIQTRQLDLVLQNQVSRHQDSSPFVLREEDFDQAVEMLMRAGLINKKVDYRLFVAY